MKYITRWSLAWTMTIAATMIAARFLGIYVLNHLITK